MASALRWMFARSLARSGSQATSRTRRRWPVRAAGAMRGRPRTQGSPGRRPPPARARAGTPGRNVSSVHQKRCRERPDASMRYSVPHPVTAALPEVSRERLRTRPASSWSRRADAGAGLSPLAQEHGARTRAPRRSAGRHRATGRPRRRPRRRRPTRWRGPRRSAAPCCRSRPPNRPSASGCRTVTAWTPSSPSRDVQEPGQIAFDGNGRMFVVELRGYMQDLDATGQLDPIRPHLRSTRTRTTTASTKRTASSSTSSCCRAGSCRSARTPC